MTIQAPTCVAAIPWTCWFRIVSIVDGKGVGCDVTVEAEHGGKKKARSAYWIVEMVRGWAWDPSSRRWMCFVRLWGGNLEGLSAILIPWCLSRVDGGVVPAATLSIARCDKDQDGS